MTARHFLCGETNSYMLINETDIPALPDTEGQLPITRLDVNTGVTGMVATNIGGVMGYRYPGHQAGAGAYYTAPVNPVRSFDIGVLVPDTIYFYRFVLPFTITVANINILAGAPDAGKFVSAALYDFNGNRMIYTEPMECTATTAVLTASISPVPILPGSYIWAWTTDSATATFLRIPEEAEYLALLNGGPVPHFGLSATASTGGALPSSIGTLSVDSGPALVGILQGA